AFALPGRKIGVHTGMLKVAETPDQLAAVLGHEVGHVMARHGNERLSQQQMARLGLLTATLVTDPNTASGRRTVAALGMGAEYGVLLPFSRAHESEADQLGLTHMARAGFDPTQSVSLWENMAAQASGRRPPEWMSTHPSTQRRISDLTASLPDAIPLFSEAAQTRGAPPCSPAPRESEHRTR
ncbi:M48 family metallopeptidase, partial [Myxococcota bacterium]|nr:M48 family metallopeptidase [Myxococcota bacterium]